MRVFVCAVLISVGAYEGRVIGPGPHGPTCVTGICTRVYGCTVSICVGQDRFVSGAKSGICAQKVLVHSKKLGPFVQYGQLYMRRSA